jgi:outer membrane autotransporter protein
MLGYGRSQGTLSRTIMFADLARSASGDPNANQFQSSVEAGRHFTLAERTVVTPLLAMQGIVIAQDSFNESGAGAINLQMQSHTTASARSVLGTELSQGLPIGLASPVLLTVRAGWGHDFADVARNSTASFEGVPSAIFSVQGAKAPRDQGLVGAGASFKLKSVDFFLRYDGALASGASMHTGTAGLRITY